MASHRLPSLACTLPLAFAAALGLGCDGNGEDDAMDAGSDDGLRMCDQETRADDFAVDLSKMGERYVTTIVDAMPAEPTRGDNTWTVRLTDGSGAPVEGIAIDVKPWMPDHGHGTSVEEQVTEMGDGEYMFTPLNLHMAGYWEITLELTDAAGELDTVMFAVCVD
ncbi:MAG: FixH family protein [Myxococcales bacterium]|nr:FixH family protein [Myxococcales bacterium]